MTIDEIITKTVNATRIVDANKPKDAFKATEKRLYAYPVIKMKIIDDKERIEDITKYGAPGRSNSVVRFHKSGMRLTDEEIAEVQIMNINAAIAGSEHEIAVIEKALGIIGEDPYKDVVKYKYFEGKSPDEIAALVRCDKVTVWRNNTRLVNKISVFLYGTEAVV